MKKVLFPILLLLSSCLAPPSVNELSNTNSEAAKKWVKWQTKWSTYKLGDYPEIKDIMHSVGFAYNANRLPQFKLSYDRAYNVSGHNDSHPSGKLRWIDWESFRQDGRPWRDPISVDELRSKHKARLDYHSTLGVEENYIHRFTTDSDNYYFDGARLIESGQLLLVPFTKSSNLVYYYKSGDLYLNKKRLVAGENSAKLLPLNHGVLLRNDRNQYYISAKTKKAIQVPLIHKIRGELDGKIYTVLNNIIYRSSLISFNPIFWRSLKAGEEFHVLKNSVLIVITVGPKFISYDSTGKSIKSSYPLVGRYRFGLKALSTNSLLFSFENAMNRKRLVEYNATNGKFKTIRFASPAFFSKGISQDFLANNFELYQSKDKKRNKLIVELYTPQSFPQYRYLGDIGRSWLEDLGSYARVAMTSLSELNSVLDLLSQKTGIDRKRMGVIAHGSQAVDLIQHVASGKVKVGALLSVDASRALSIQDASILPPIYMLSNRYGDDSPFPTRMLVRELHQLDANYYFVEKVAKKNHRQDYYQEFKAVRASEFAFFGIHL